MPATAVDRCARCGTPPPGRDRPDPGGAPGHEPLPLLAVPQTRR